MRITPLFATCFWAAGHALQTHVQDSHKFDPLSVMNFGDAPPSSFVANADTACFEGHPRAVEGALAIKKAQPRGSMYAEVFAKSNMTCRRRGYKTVAYDDDCYPGLKKYFKKPGDEYQFNLAETAAVRKYMTSYNLDPDSVSLMHACTCHVGSNSHRKRAEDCRGFRMHGTFLEHSGDGEALLCHGGPYTSVARALATLKSSPNLPMHLADQVVPLTCSQRKFRYNFDSTETCFAGVRTWGRKRPEHGAGDGGMKRAALMESKLFRKGGFRRFEQQHALNDAVLNGIEGCQCSPKSFVGSRLGKICWQPGSSSPIRDWWRE